MSRSYKKPILRDRARGKSERAFYSRIYRNKVKQFISNRMLGMYHNCLNDVINDFEDFSDIDLPRYSEAYNWWDFCDYSCDHRKECCYYYNNSRKCRRFPNIPLEIYKDHIQDICEECRREFSRK